MILLTFSHNQLNLKLVATKNTFENITPSRRDRLTFPVSTNVTSICVWFTSLEKPRSLTRNMVFISEKAALIPKAKNIFICMIFLGQCKRLQ